MRTNHILEVLQKKLIKDRGTKATQEPTFQYYLPKRKDSKKPTFLVQYDETPFECDGKALVPLLYFSVISSHQDWYRIQAKLSLQD